MKNIKSEYGFSAVMVIVFLLVLGVVGAGGYYVYNQNSNKDKTSTSTPTNTVVKQEETPEQFWEIFVKNYKLIASQEDPKLKKLSIESLDKLVTTDTINQLSKVLKETQAKD